MTTTRPIVTIENVDVAIEGRTVLERIDFSIRRGQHWGIVGANGSGKSTLLALIAGTRWPAPGKGSRRYDFGQGPEHDAVTARQRITLIGHELQELYEARSWNFLARDVVHSGLTRSDIPRRHRTGTSLAQAERLLASMKVEHLAKRRLLELSRGEQRRVLITRALAFEPVLLLLDEPMSGLDAAARRDLEVTLQRASAHTSLVIAAHDESQLPRLVTNVALISDGELVETRMREPAQEHGQSRPAANARARPRRRPDDIQSHRPQRHDADEPVIELQNVSVWLQGKEVLKSIDWTLRRGQSWLVTGSNGSGKSTLLRLLHAEVRPARGGRIVWHAFEDARDVWALRRQIALVSPALQARYRYPSTVLDAIASGFRASIGLTEKLSSEQAHTVSELVAAFELEGVQSRPLLTLSYGQRLRALIARTLVAKPRLVLLDEPWEGLDSESIEIVGREIGKRMADGMQVICVSHVGAGSLDLDCILALEDGRIVNADDKDARPGSSASAQPQAPGCR